MPDDIYPPIHWHANTELPQYRRAVTWIGVESPKQVDGIYDGGGVLRADKGGREVRLPGGVVQWRYRDMEPRGHVSDADLKNAGVK